MKVIYSGLLMLLICMACQPPDRSANGATNIQGKWAQRHRHNDRSYHDFIAFLKPMVPMMVSKMEKSYWLAETIISRGIH